MAKSQKLTGYDLYRHLGSPKFVVAPMVDQSELAWRRLSRRYGASLIYTPMINAKMFAEGSRKGYRDQNFNLTLGEEGGPEDRPLIVQFCANDPEKLLVSAKYVQAHCDAVDINLGCPQEIARRGHYGSFLQDDWDLIYKLINTLHEKLDIPVTAKFRVFPTVEKTVEYAKMLERAGAQILTCHGRTREQRGQLAGLADWEKIRAVKKAVSVPVFANGNILYHSDIERCLAATGADAIMSAEGQLYNAALFGPSPSSLKDKYTLSTGFHPPHTDLALEYLEIVKSLKTKTSGSAVKGHLFKLMRPALSRETDLRERLGKVRIGRDACSGTGLDEYVQIVKEMKARMDRDIEAVGDTPLEDLITVEPITGLKVLPHWLAQPYFRPSKPQLAPSSGSKTESQIKTGSPPSDMPTQIDLSATESSAKKRQNASELPVDLTEIKRARIEVN